MKKIIKDNSGIEDFVDIGQEVTVIKTMKAGEQHPGLPSGNPILEDLYWIKEIGDFPFAGLIKENFE